MAKTRTRPAALYGSQGAGHRWRGATARKRALVQQPGGSRRRLAARGRVLAARRGHHQAHQPCGCAEQGTLAEAYRKALECDPVSAFGGVIGFNRAVDEETAREMAKLFVEAIAAPDYADGGARYPQRQEKSPADEGRAGAGSARGQIHLRRISGADPRCPLPGPGRYRSEVAARAHGCRMGRARVRLESRQAREVQRHRVRARGPDRGSGRGPDEPGRFR